MPVDTLIAKDAALFSGGGVVCVWRYVYVGDLNVRGTG